MGVAEPIGDYERAEEVLTDIVMHTRQLLLEQALLLWAVNRDSFHGAYPDSPLPLVCLAVVKPQVLAPLATAEDVESDMQQGDQVMDAQERGDIGI